MRAGFSLLLFAGLARAGPDSLASMVQQAQVAEHENRLDDAAALYTKILKVRPGWASAELNLGLVHHSRGDYQAAIRTLSNALRHQSDLHSALLFRGASYYQTDHPDEAVRDLTEYLRHRPDDPEALPILAGAYLARGDPAQAAVAYEALARITNDAAVWYRLSDCYARIQLSERARFAIARVFAVAPESGWAALLRAQAADEAGQVETADLEYRKAMAAAGAAAEMHVRYGQFQCKHGRLDEGLASYQKALQMEPSRTDVSGLIGEVHVLQNRPEQAIRFLRKALQSNPREQQVRLYLAQCLNQTGRAAEAVRVLEAAPEDPDGRIHYVLGRTLQKLGQTEKARKAMEVFRQRRESTKH